MRTGREQVNGEGDHKVRGRGQVDGEGDHKVRGRGQAVAPTMDVRIRFAVGAYIFRQMEDRATTRDRPYHGRTD
jgi:hypothetical protein